MTQDDQQSETGCCPIFNPDHWEDKEVSWDHKKFLKAGVRKLFHMPLNYGSVMTRSVAMIAAAEATTIKTIVLTDEVSPWHSDVYISVGKDVPSAEVVGISGTFLTKVFEGPYKDMGKWIKEMQVYVASKNEKPKKMYFFYTTCPKCAEVYGKNYVVILAQIK